MSKEIKVSILNKTTLVIQEKAEQGDRIDLTKIEGSLDTSTIDSIFNTIKDKKIVEEINRNAKLIVEKEKIKLENELSKEYEKKLGEKEKEITQLQTSNKNIEEKTKLQIEKEKEKIIADKEKEIAQLQTSNKNIEEKVKLQIEKEKDKIIFDKEKQIANKEKEIVKLESEKKQLEANEKVKVLEAVKEKDSKIEELQQKLEKKKFDLSIGSKDLGEDLERYCQEIFEQEIAPNRPQAEFHKFNKTMRGISENKEDKGDFVYFEDLGNNRYLTIMFEMKNKKDDTKGTLNRNYYEKAISDRNNAGDIEEYTHNQGCKYAVIVSMLEPDLDFDYKKIPSYNDLWVVRPKFFKNIISILRDKEMAIAIETKQLAEQVNELKIVNKTDDEFESKLTNAKKEAFNSFKNIMNSMDDDVKDIIEILKILCDMAKRKYIEKKHVSTLFKKICNVKSRTKDSDELKGLKREVEQILSRKQEFGKFTQNQIEAKELSIRLLSNVTNIDDNEENDDEDDNRL